MDQRLADFKSAYAARKASPSEKPAENCAPATKKTRPTPRTSVPTSEPVTVPPERLLLFKQAFGAEVRDRRLIQGLTLRDLSHKAAVSLGYLSEIERGLKEPSSEVIACVTKALNGDVPEMLIAVAFRISDGLPSKARPDGLSAEPDLVASM